MGSPFTWAGLAGKHTVTYKVYHRQDRHVATQGESLRSAPIAKLQLRMGSYPIQTGSDVVVRVEAFVQDYMSRFDASHDFQHIQRVVRLAKHIATSEHQKKPDVYFDLNLVELAALLHDVNDRKYKTSSTASITEHLTRLGCSDASLASAVEDIVSHVSFHHERLNPEAVADALKRHPELGVVQDADRIDAVGAVGIGRLFTYGGAKDRTLDMSIDHLDERLIRTADYMKTETGKSIILERMRRLEQFRNWWTEETTFTRSAPDLNDRSVGSTRTTHG